MTHAIVQRATVASAPRAGTASTTWSRTVPTAVRVPNRKVDRPAHRTPCITALHAASSADAVADLRPLPQTCAEQVTQAASVIRAASTSHRRQRIQLLLPINQRKNEFTSVESDDYGMNDADVYKAAMETASAMIRGSRQPS